MSRERITLVVEDPNWLKSRGLPKLLKAAAAAGSRAGGLPKSARFTILLADDAKLRALNHAFRGKDEATNVLSFPAAPNREGHAGDIALAYGVTRTEAKAARKTIADHARHLVVHGVLHLAGFDHQKDRDARKMESLETKILSRLGIADPYGSIGQQKCGASEAQRRMRNGFAPCARSAPLNKGAHPRPGRATSTKAPRP